MTVLLPLKIAGQADGNIDISRNLGVPGKEAVGSQRKARLTTTVTM